MDHRQKEWGHILESQFGEMEFGKWDRTQRQVSKSFPNFNFEKIDFYLPIGEQVGIYFMLQGDVSAYIVFLEVYNLYIFVYIFFQN